MVLVVAADKATCWLVDTDDEDVDCDANGVYAVAAVDVEYGDALDFVGFDEEINPKPLVALHVDDMACQLLSAS